MQPNFVFLEARDLNQSSFDNIVETKEQLSTTKNFQPDLLKIKLAKIKRTVSLTENNNAINYSKLINLKGLKLPLIENIIKSSLIIVI
jgi:hypothetical protein